jgi:hypothetical protein
MMEREIAGSTLTPVRVSRPAWVPFLVASIAGSAILLYLKHLDVHQFYVTLLAVTFIFAYAFAGRLFSAIRLREDQLGDNCYYLGFIYTLVSLCWALYLFSGKTSDIGIVVSSFGLALGSTIAGIVARVTLNQMRRDQGEYETDFRMAMESAVFQLRSKIHDAVSALDTFCTTTRQVAQEAIEKTAQDATGAIAEGIKKVGESTDTILQSVGDSTSSVLHHIDAAFTEFQEHSAQLSEGSKQTVEGSKQTVKALQALIKKIEKIDTPSDVISRQLEPVLDAATRAASVITERINSDAKSMAEIQERTLAIDARMGRMADDMGAVIAALKASAEASKSTAEAANEALQAQSRASRSVVDDQQAFAQEAQRSAEALFQVLKSSTDGLAAQVTRHRQIITEMSGSLGEMAVALAERADQLVTSDRPGA